METSFFNNTVLLYFLPPQTHRIYRSAHTHLQKHTHREELLVSFLQTRDSLGYFSPIDPSCLANKFCLLKKFLTLRSYYFVYIYWRRHIYTYTKICASEDKFLMNSCLIGSLMFFSSAFLHAQMNSSSFSS